MKKRKYYPEVLALAAAFTVVSAGIGKAWSYFTTYAEAAGGYTIHLGDRTEITEEFSGWTKHVRITNDEGSEPVYIRARAFCGSQYSILYSGEGWTLESDGYYYYDSIVYGGGSAAVLDLKIEGISEEPEDKERFNVIVIYESIPVKYHEDGTAYTVWETDWSEILDTGSTGSTGSSAENADSTGNADDGENADNTGNADDGENADNTGNADDGENADSTGNADNTGNPGNAGDTGTTDNAGNADGADSTGNSDNADSTDNTEGGAE